MARRKIERRVPRVTLTRAEAAAALGVSVDHFDRHIRPELRSVLTGTLRLWSLVELEKWAERNGQAELGMRISEEGR